MANPVLELQRQGQVLPGGHLCQPGKDQSPSTYGASICTPHEGNGWQPTPGHLCWGFHKVANETPTSACATLWHPKAAEILINSLKLRVQWVLPITMKLLKELEGSMFWFYMLWCSTSRTCHSPRPSCCRQMWAAFPKANVRSISHIHLQKCCSSEVSAANPHESK